MRRSCYEQDPEQVFTLKSAKRAYAWLASIAPITAREWEAMTSIASKIGCTAETLRRWCREEASRRMAAQATDDKLGSSCWNARSKELRRTNRSARKASAYFAQAELDRQGKW